MSALSKYLIFVCLLGFLHFSVSSQTTADTRNGITIVVSDSLSAERLEYAIVALSAKGAIIKSGLTGQDGKCTLDNVPNGAYTLRVSCMGYAEYSSEITVGPRALFEVILATSAINIDNVVVTASESKGMTSSSRIRRTAMEHLQPSSFTDLLELLPGGRSQDPVFGKPNSIRLREVPGYGSSYNTSSLGTLFLVDGAPISTDANMQFISGEPDTGISSLNNVNSGVDMRTISTDDIESVEIVRGIPSVEYGNLTSGLVKIERKKGGRKLEARFKADMMSKLYYLGKGFEIPDRKMTVNLDFDLLDAKSDPRDRLKNYKRLTGSARVSKKWDMSKHSIDFSSALDYTGSFDNVKTDPDLHYGNIDKFKSSYNRFAWNGNLLVKPHNPGFFRNFRMTTALSYEHDKIDRARFVQTQRPTPIPNTMKEGESDAVLLPGSYIAQHEVDGKPFTAFVKAMATFRADAKRLTNEIKVGSDWSMAKNYGEGQIFDMARPISPNLSTRPRPYTEIPGQHDLAFFVEDLSSLKLGNFTASLMAGLRASAMLNLGEEYKMHGKFYYDPRVNGKIEFPSFNIGDQKVSTELSGGIGWHTKSPTMNQLYPSLLYYDIRQFNYFPSDPEYRRINLLTYIIDRTNFELAPARNFKWEIRGDVLIGGNRLSLTWFNEDMKSGFRSSTRYASYVYKDYIEEQAPAPPFDLDQVPYVMDTLQSANSMTTNGSRTLKKGLEFTFTSKRIESIRTRLTITGAWFKTRYQNSQPEYAVPSGAPGNDQYPYVGIYIDGGSNTYEMVNTNFMFDTDVSRLGLRFSVSFQCMWYNFNKSMPADNVPGSYIDRQGVVRPYTEASRQDAYLQHLVRNYTSNTSDVPFAMNVNLKATKTLFNEKMTIALFVNKLLDCSPDYTRSGFTIRRSVRPYFGMEMNFKL